jgi:hypothetical protein
MKFVVYTIAVLASFWLTPRLQAQQPPTFQYTEEQNDERSEDWYAEQLRRERYETALAQERARQAYLNNQALMYESQRRQQETYIKRAEQQRRYDQRSNDISTVNQAANTVAAIARQIQILSNGRADW